MEKSRSGTLLVISGIVLVLVVLSLSFYDFGNLMCKLGLLFCSCVSSTYAIFIFY